MASRKDAIAAVQDYPNLEMRIARRKDEIEYPYQADEDENIGGGRLQNVRSEVIEKKLEKKDSDPVLKFYLNQQYAVESTLAQCVKKDVRSLLDDATYDIIYEFYLRETQIYNADQVAERVNLSRRAVYNRREAFIEAVQAKLN